MPIDERDELTRLQNELTSSPSDDPRRSSLQARISDLLRIHGASWAGPRATTSWKRIWDDVDQTTLIQQFGPVFGDGDKWEFRSGRLANCSISMSDFLTCGEAIRSRTNLHELTLHGIGGDGLVDMRRARFDKLRRLNAPDVILKNEVQALARAQQCCPFQKVLDCKHLLGIQRLRFERLGLFAGELEEFLAGRFLQDVESLYLYQFSDAFHGAYQKLGQLPMLQHLDFESWSDSCGDRGIDVGNEEDARTLASSPALAQLRTLRLRYHEIGNDGMLALAGSEHLRSLQTLDLRGNYSSITNSGIVKLAAMSQVARLRELNLSQCDFDTEGALALARSRHLDNLEELHLAPCEESYEMWKGISGRDFALELSKPECLPALLCLNISNQMIGDDGIRALTKSPRFARFQKLTLMHQGFSDAGLIALASSPYTPKLQALNLAWNPIGDSGIAALCQSDIAEGVEVFRLDGTPNTGELLANSRFESLVELWVERLDESILEPLKDSTALKSLRRLVFQSGVAPSELLQRKNLEPVYLLPERSLPS